MTAIDTRSLREPLARRASPKGPVTVARQRRTWLIYAAMVILGFVPVLANAPAECIAAGLGFWLPGAGFVAVGGWSILLFPVTLAIFCVSLVAWFWAGMVLAPVAIWLGSALIAGFMADGHVMPGAHVVVALAMAGIGFAFRQRAEKRRVADEAKAVARAGYVPPSLAEVEVAAAAIPAADAREIAADDLPSLRYVLDRALQPVERFDGFDIIDQFQPAALRYQLNHMGFALAVAQGSYCPNFTGYLGEAQRNLIEKYLLRKVWGYWVYESCWGHLNFTNWDPANRDNIMLTGWFGMHVGAYMLNSGDRRYAEPGALTFRLNPSTAYVHDFHTIIGSVVKNYETAEFGLFACEPNWIYPICNHYGMSSLAVHDKLYGTRFVATHLPNWMQKLDTEFTDGSGSIIGLRSQLTGIEFPFPVGEAGYAMFADVFVPERARRLWATARKEIEPALVKGADGREQIVLPGKGLDPGNYRPGFVAAFGGILTSAREFGDERIAEAALNSLEAQCGVEVVGGVRRYAKGSNLANVNAAMGRLMRTGDFRRAFVEGPSEKTLAGPVLAEARYPDVLVARAYSDGTDLSLVLHGTGRQTLGLDRLRPGATYAVEGGPGGTLVADANGKARIDVDLAGRTALRIAPLS
jgi:hypothetical protein